METIGARELRSDLATFLRRAEAGESVVVTVDGRPVARLGPVAPDGAPSLDDLVAAGLVDPPRRAPAPGGRPAPDPLDPPVDVRVDRVLDDLRGAP